MNKDNGYQWNQPTQSVRPPNPLHSLLAPKTTRTVSSFLQNDSRTSNQLHSQRIYGTSHHHVGTSAPLNNPLLLQSQLSSYHDEVVEEGPVLPAALLPSQELPSQTAAHLLEAMTRNVQNVSPSKAEVLLEKLTTAAGCQDTLFAMVTSALAELDRKYASINHSEQLVLSAIQGLQQTIEANNIPKVILSSAGTQTSPATSREQNKSSTPQEKVIMTEQENSSSCLARITSIKTSIATEENNIERRIRRKLERHRRRLMADASAYDDEL